MARYFDPKVWRPIPGYEKYVCDKDGHVANRQSGVTLSLTYLNRHRSKRTGEIIGTKGYGLLKSGYPGDSRRANMTPQACVRLAWPDLPIDHIMVDGVEFRQCYPGNDSYYISAEGILINHRYNNRQIRLVIHSDGSMTARVTLDGIQHVVDIDDLIDQVWHES